MATRSKDGLETWRRLLDWGKGQAAAERLAALILRIDGFESIDPSHPLGGRDGLKDVICKREGRRWIGAFYFPRGQKPFVQIRDKFTADLQGLEANQADGIAFVLNQELKIA